MLLKNTFYFERFCNLNRRGSGDEYHCESFKMQKIYIICSWLYFIHSHIYIHGISHEFVKNYEYLEIESLKNFATYDYTFLNNYKGLYEKETFVIQIVDSRLLAQPIDMSPYDLSKVSQVDLSLIHI